MEKPEDFVKNLIKEFQSIETNFSSDGGYTFYSIDEEAYICAEITLNKIIKFNSNKYFEICLEFLKNNYNV